MNPCWSPPGRPPRSMTNTGWPGRAACFTAGLTGACAGESGTPVRVRGSGRAAAACGCRACALIAAVLRRIGGGTGVPSSMLLLVLGEPVSTPAGIWLDCEAFGGSRGGDLVRDVCASAARGKRTTRAAPTRALRRTDGSSSRKSPLVHRESMSSTIRQRRVQTLLRSGLGQSADLDFSRHSVRPLSSRPTWPPPSWPPGPWRRAARTRSSPCPPSCRRQGRP